MGPGSTINNRYRVVREIGKGGMGRVFLAEDTHAQDRRVALKTILGGVPTRDFLARFRVEFAGLSKLSHPNVAAAHDFGQMAGTGEHFFTAEYIDGVDLFEGTADANGDQLVDIASQTLRGLGFIHSHGLLHNDLKPSNILLLRAGADEGAGQGGRARLEAAVLGSAGLVKIIDFGLLSTQNVAWSAIFGTATYISPERILRKPADARSDLYSLGIVLYVVCARGFPFYASDVQDMLKLHLEATPPDLSRRRPDLPPPLREMITKLLAKKPEDRFSSAAEALRFLTEGLARGGAAPVATKQLTLTSGSLVERDAELEVLLTRLERMNEGSDEPPSIVVEGPPGIGKTRLVRELRAAVQTMGGAYIEVGGSAVEGHLVPVLDAIVKGLETSGATDLGELRRRRETPGEGGADLGGALERAVIAQAKLRPLLIHFDDFHAASGVVRRFATELLHAAWKALKGEGFLPRILVVISRRESKLRDDLGLHGAKPLNLKPLDTAASRRFLQRIFQTEEVPEGMLEDLARAAGGYPGLLLELARELVASGHVTQEGLRWRFPPSLARVPLAGSVGDLIARRVASLDPESRGLLEWLSLASIPLCARVVARCALSEDAHTGFILDCLSQRGLVVHEEVGNERVYAVAHKSARDAALVKISEDRLPGLHRRIAQAFEEEKGKPEGSRAEVLARHWHAAGNAAAFLRYGPAAAAYLQACGDLERAAECQGKVVESLGPDAVAKKVQALAKLSEMLELDWDLDASQAAVGEVLSLGAGLLKPAERAALLRRQASLDIAAHRPQRALDSLDLARRALGEGADPAVTPPPHRRPA